MSRTWIWSDTHFFHKKIIEMGNRPFSSVVEMDEALFKAWVETVAPEDTLWHLGDFALYRSKPRIWNLVSGMPGYKHLILGNHDRDKPVGWWKDAGFDEVHANPFCYEDKVVLSHEPSTPMTGVLNIHGHTHKENPHTRETHLNVSVEQIGYSPVDLDNCIGIWKRRMGR